MKRWIVITIGIVLVWAGVTTAYTPYTDPITPGGCGPVDAKQYWSVFSGRDGIHYAYVNTDRLGNVCPDDGYCHAVEDLSHKLLGYVSMFQKPTGNVRGIVYLPNLTYAGQIVAVPGSPMLWFYLDNPFDFQYYFYTNAY